MELEIFRNLVKKNKSKIVLLVLDGLGGLPMSKNGTTELETASTPNLDDLTAEGICGLHQPIGPGITPGSGPAHLSLFGYNPIKYQVGRGVLAALGINFDLQPEDVAARGNFCTIDKDGRVTDRRAGRISSDKNRELCEQLQKIKLSGADVFVKTVKEHRFLLVLRGHDLKGDLEDTDPQEVGKKPLPPEGLSRESEQTVLQVTEFVEQAREILKDHHPANMLLLRGFSKKPDWQSMNDVFGIKTAAIAAYPMYRGVSKLIGMDILETGDSVEDEIQTMRDHWDEYDFFYVHIKKTDSAGEDGDFDRKVSLIEKVDEKIPEIRGLKPDVVVVTGDHSTPSRMKYHSWHPVPALIWSESCRQDAVKKFGEKDCIQGA
ncbi:2,3-bisphosphoglycerate-independent phosphoglycerate mutase, partial [candidate division KSB1 bacterium]|nr:2,3-bisphosphoglycerate-independent phosphoglycerate mutase [candidate division KSB1 bacterium]